MPWDGIPITPLPRALADAAPDLDDEQLEAAYEKAIVKWQLPPTLIPKRNRRLNQLIKDHERGTALTDSDLENLFRTIIKKAGLPQPESNADVWTGERFYRPDFLWRDRMLVVEIDGDVHEGQRQADDRRAARLAALGYTILRFNRLQLIRHQHEVAAALRPFL
jgi:very-short-patch-repair endonuclease